MVRVRSFFKPYNKWIYPKLYPIPNQEMDAFIRPTTLIHRGKEKKSHGQTYYEVQVRDLRPLQSQPEIPGRDHYMDAFRKGLTTKYKPSYDDAPHLNLYERDFPIVKD